MHRHGPVIAHCADSEGFPRTILSLFNQFAAFISLMLSSLLFHLLIPLWKSTIALSAMPHFIFGMNFPKNFVNLSMMSPCHCQLIFLSPVHHHHHFHYASLHLCSTPNSKLITFSINPSLHTLPPTPFRMDLTACYDQFPDLIADRFFLFLLFSSFFCLIRVID